MTEECHVCRATIDVGERGTIIVTGQYERDGAEPHEDLQFDFGGDEYHLCDNCGTDVIVMLDKMKNRRAVGLD